MREAGTPLGTKEDEDAGEVAYDSCSDARVDETDDDFDAEEWDNKRLGLDYSEALQPKHASMRKRKLSDEDMDQAHASEELKERKKSRE